MDKGVIGVDLGGKIVRARAFTRAGQMLSMKEMPIEAARGPELGLRKIQGLIEQVWAETEADSLVGIGIGSMGPLDPIRGIINNPFTLPTWKNVPAVDWLRKPSTCRSRWKMTRGGSIHPKTLCHACRQTCRLIPRWYLHTV